MGNKRVMVALNVEVRDDTTGRGIVDLHWVKALRIEGDEAELTVTFPPSCGGGKALAEGAFALARWQARRETYDLAARRAAALHRPLVVIGDPDAGASTRLLRAYDCGEVCVDAKGCPMCPVMKVADITAGPIPGIPSNSAVVFVSCVLEYVGDLPAALTADMRAGLHLSAAELALVKNRIKTEDLSVLGVRFTHDVMCPKARFDRLRSELGTGFEAIEIDSGPGNAHGIPRIAHSVVTMDLVDREGHPTRQALDRIIGYFQQRLLTAG